MTVKDVRSAEAFAPGHITGFFAMEDEGDDPAAIGSVGAGFSVEKGVRSRVRMRPGGYPSIDLKINGEPAEAATSRRAVELLLAKDPWEVHVEQRMDLPSGQGFGMSGAGALSAALAVGSVIGRTPEEARAAAHAAEVAERTGLGDVVGAFVGGFEVRRKPGLPPTGQIEPFEKDNRPSVLLAVVDPELPTRSVLADPERRARIIALGRDLVGSFGTEATLHSFVETSRRFSERSGLQSEGVRQALADLGEGALASQSMLGGSIFVLSPSQRTVRDFKGRGWAATTKVSAKGARVTRPARR